MKTFLTQMPGPGGNPTMLNACSPYASTGPMGHGTITGPSKNSSRQLSFGAAISFNCTHCYVIDGGLDDE
jgi:hypothetical protein